MFHYSKWCK